MPQTIDLNIPEETYTPGWGEFLVPNDTSSGRYYPLHEFQKPVYKSDRRFTAAVAGTGGGKTAVGALWVQRQIDRALLRTQNKTGKPFCLGFIVAPTYKVLSRATVPTFLDVIEYTAYGPRAGGRYLESKSYYELPHGWGKIWCQGADNPYGLEGGQFDFVWMDEGGQIEQKAFNALVGRTGQKQAPILVTTTPYITSDGFGPLHKQWYPRWQAGDPDYFLSVFPSIANPAYPQEEFERQKRLMPKAIFESRYMGLFTAIMGMVYPNFSRTLIDLPPSDIRNILSSSSVRIYGGLDYGWNDPFAGLLGALDTITDTLYIFWERYKSHTTLDEHASKLPKTIYSHHPLWYSEHNPEAIYKLKKGGHQVKPAPKFKKGQASSAIMNGILAVNARINSDRLKVIRSACPALIAEANTYIYPEKNEEIIGDKPLDKDNHTLDALRYLVTGIDFKKSA